jgi:hypothetical protein
VELAWLAGWLEGEGELRPLMGERRQAQIDAALEHDAGFRLNRRLKAVA